MGLIAGFPDWSAKFGLDYEFDALPLTLHASYETIHLVTMAQVSNATADATAYSADYAVRKWATVSAEYDHTRQTSQAANDDYALRLALRF
jgi:predicted porin